MKPLTICLCLAVLAGCVQSPSERSADALEKIAKSKEPAFPVVVRTDSPGMNLRDYFAIHAPPLPDAEIDHYADAAKRQARWRYEFADAMMIERAGVPAP